jgi:hypothetical protein
MFEWVSLWWTNKSLSGPARNAPNDGKNIKELIEQKPDTVLLVSQSEINNIRNKLKKTVQNEPYKTETPKLFLDLNKVFQQGNDKYFENIRKKREEKKPKINIDLEKASDQLAEESKKIASELNKVLDEIKVGTIQIDNQEFEKL